MKRSAPTVLMVTQFYWPEIVGSAPYCTDLAEWLAREGWRVRILTCRPHYPEGVVPVQYRDGLLDRETRRGATIDRLPPWQPARRGALGRMLGEFAFLGRGLWALATGRVSRSDVVISLCPSVLAVVLGRLSCRWGGHHVAMVHDIQSGLASGLGMVGGSWLLRLMRALERWALNGTDGIFVLSENMRERLRNQGITTPIEVMPIWVDADLIQPVERTSGAPTTVLYSGNLGRKQALDQVIELAEVLQRRGSTLRVVVRGKGGEADRLMAEAANRGLRNIEFHPLVPADRFSESLAEGDVHLVPQDAATADFAVPSKIYSIMAAGRPFVATALPDSHLWRLQQQTGAFQCVPPGDADALADAVLALGADSRRREDLGARGRAFVVARHDKPVVLGGFEATLRKFIRVPIVKQPA
ncbi:glycosyltransferase [Thalassobaculum sp.]|uniref:glycosyltransferase n=1 Tax=Thalassobaculum sp. TaxID=2022740 RepID=UPI0032EBBBB0